MASTVSGIATQACVSGGTYSLLPLWSATSAKYNLCNGATLTAAFSGTLTGTARADGKCVCASGHYYSAATPDACTICPTGQSAAAGTYAAPTATCADPEEEGDDEGDDEGEEGEEGDESNASFLHPIFAALLVAAIALFA